VLSQITMAAKSFFSTLKSWETINPVNPDVKGHLGHDAFGVAMTLLSN